MGSGASVRPSPNAVTDQSIFFIANASRFTLKVRYTMEKDPPAAAKGSKESKEVADKDDKDDVKKSKASGETKKIGIQEVVQLKGKFVEIFLLDKNDKETPLGGGQRPVQPCKALIVTEKKAVKVSSCALSGPDDPNAWISGGVNLFPGEFFVANASGAKLVVVTHDKRRVDVDAKVLKHKEVGSFRGDTARIFSPSGKEVHSGDVKVRTSLIIAEDDKVLHSRQLVGDDVNMEKWITADGKYCKP